MPEMDVVSASIRVRDSNKKAVCNVNNVDPFVTAETAEGFTDAIETIYNNGLCTATLTLVFDIPR
jgi:hypothetical protein